MQRSRVATKRVIWEATPLDHDVRSIYQETPRPNTREQFDYSDQECHRVDTKHRSNWASQQLQIENNSVTFLRSDH